MFIYILTFLVFSVSTKTQFIWFGTPQQLQKLDFAFLSEQFPLISFLPSVRDLGFSSLTFVEHISNLTCSSYFHLRHLRVFPFSLVFLRFISLQFSWSSIQLQGV